MVLLLAFSGCTGYDCTLLVEPAVIVEIYDRTSGAPAVEGSRGFIQDGIYRDTLQRYESVIGSSLPALAGAWGPAGTYQLQIQNPSYSPWDTVGVRVTRGKCGPQTVRFVVRLTPL